MRARHFKRPGSVFKAARPGSVLKAARDTQRQAKERLSDVAALVNGKYSVIKPFVLHGKLLSHSGRNLMCCIGLKIRGIAGKYAIVAVVRILNGTPSEHITGYSQNTGFHGFGLLNIISGEIGDALRF